VSYPLATYRKNSYKLHPILKKSIDITFIKNCPVVFESILTDIHLYIHIKVLDIILSPVEILVLMRD